MRSDAKRVKNINGLTQILIDLKPYRCDSDVYINEDIDVTELVKYIEKKKSKNKDITFFHAFITAMGKTIYNRDKLNRFIANRHTYEHNDVVISFVAKVSFDDKSEQVMIMIPIDKEDNIDTISKKVTDKINSYRKKNGKKEGANSAIDTIGKLPNIIRVPLVGLLKWCDDKGILPKSLMKDNVYYSSMMVSNIGSLKCGAIYHNLTNLGTCSSLVTIGEIKDKEVLINGKKEIRKMCEFGITIDERVAEGYYLIKCIKLLEKIFENPKMLEDRADTKIKSEELGK